MKNVALDDLHAQGRSNEDASLGIYKRLEIEQLLEIMLRMRKHVGVES
jgi:hypothetical protein